MLWRGCVRLSGTAGREKTMTVPRPAPVRASRLTLECSSPRSARSSCTWRPRARPPGRCGPTPRRCIPASGQAPSERPGPDQRPDHRGPEQVHATSCLVARLRRSPEYAGVHHCEVIAGRNRSISGVEARAGPSAWDAAGSRCCPGGPAITNLRPRLRPGVPGPACGRCRSPRPGPRPSPAGRVAAYLAASGGPRPRTPRQRPAAASRAW